MGTRGRERLPRLPPRLPWSRELRGVAGRVVRGRCGHRHSRFDPHCGLEGEGHDAVAVAIGRDSLSHGLLAFIFGAIGVLEELDDVALGEPWVGMPSSITLTVVTLLPVPAEEIKGKFWKLLGPVDVEGLAEAPNGYPPLPAKAVAWRLLFGIY